MKLSFKLLDLLCLDCEFKRAEHGGWSFHGLFPKFIDRPGEPHLSLFGEPKEGFFTPHYTVWGGVFRRTLARIRPEKLAAFERRASLQLYATWLESIEPVTVDDLEQGGWLVHCVDWRAISRWLKRYCGPGAELRIDDDFAYAFAGHVMRHRGAPRCIEQIKDSVVLPVMRWGQEPPEMRLLYHCPAGIVKPSERGVVEVVAPSGWYWSTRPLNAQEWVAENFPVSRLRRVVAKIEQFLKRVPRTIPAAQRSSLPGFVSQILGLYAADLLRLATGLTLQRCEGLPEAN